MGRAKQNLAPRGELSEAHKRPMGLDDGTADGDPHAGAEGFVVKNALDA